MKKLGVLGVLLALILVPTYQASAHELVIDTAGDKGAVLHIGPLDDPIAGRKSTIFLAVRDLPSAATVKGVLMVHDQRGTTQLVSAKFRGSMAYADYTFPDQGVYTLTFVIKAAGQTYTFTKDQQVTRGTEVPGSVDIVKNYGWANYVLGMSLVLAALVCIMAWWRRKSIARTSTY